MAKTNNNDLGVAGSAENQNTGVAVATENTSFIKEWQDKLAFVADQEKSALVEISSTYLSFKENEKYVLAVTGLTSIVDDQGEEKTAVSLMNKEGESLTNANALLVSAVKKLESQIPFAIVIETKGKVKGKNGSYLDMKIYRAS